MFDKKSENFLYRDELLQIIKTFKLYKAPQQDQVAVEKYEI